MVSYPRTCCSTDCLLKLTWGRQVARYRYWPVDQVTRFDRNVVVQWAKPHATDGRAFDVIIPPIH